MEQLRSIIKTENLSVIYFLGKSNQVDALVDANIEIFPGEFIIFFGPSGCGKSTLLYAIAGLEKNIRGKIFIDDKNIAEYGAEEIEHFHQKKIGMIFQAYYLISSLTVVKNVVLPQFSVNAGRKERDARSAQLMEKFGVLSQAGKYPNELSGGQQQRVAICRALINEPEIILADEPTGNLDSKSTQDVMGLLHELNEKNNKTVILVTHSPANLHLANRVFYMKDGRIIQVKVNRELGKKEAVAAGEPGLEKIAAAKDLEFLAKTYTSFSTEKLGHMLIPFKAQEIVSEVLTHMTVEEAKQIEKNVEVMLTKGVADSAAVYQYLDKDIKEGGLGMDSRAAKKVADKIQDIVAEIKILIAEEERIKIELGHDSDEEVRKVRHYLFDTFNVRISEVESLKVINRTIRERLENKIDGLELQRILDLPIRAGGAGLEKRLSLKLARRLELLILGKYPSLPPVGSSSGPVGITGIVPAKPKGSAPVGMTPAIAAIAERRSILSKTVGEIVREITGKIAARINNSFLPKIRANSFLKIVIGLGRVPKRIAAHIRRRAQFLSRLFADGRNFFRFGSVKFLYRVKWLWAVVLRAIRPRGPMKKIVDLLSDVIDDIERKWLEEREERIKKRLSKYK